MPNLTSKEPYYSVKRVIRQPDALRRHGTLPRSPKHSGLGITLTWLNCNLFYQNDRMIWSATCSDESLQKAARIDAEVTAELNAVYRLDDFRASVPNYDVNVLFNIIRRVCQRPSYLFGFTLRLPQSNQALLIPKVVELQNYTGRGIIFLLGIPSCNSDSSLSYFSLLSL